MNVTPGPNSPSVQETLTFAISYSLPSSISSIVFACIAATLLLAFLIWRGVRFCGLCCCKYARFLPDPNGLTSRDKYLKGKWIAGVKVSGVIGGLCLIAASLYGIIESSMGGHYTNNNNLVQQGWYVLGVLVTYVATTVVTLRQLMYNLNLIGVTVDMIVGITNDTLCRYEVDPLPPDVVEQATEVTSTTYDVTYAAGMTANSIYQSLVQAYEETHNTWEETTLTIWNYLVIGYLVILTLVLIGSLLFMGATIFNHTTGLFWTVTIHLFQSLLFFILCIAFTIGMASLKESCYSAEGFITASTSYPPAQALLKYYLNSNSTSTDILQILNVANINITAIERILASPIASLPLYPDILNDTNIQSRCIPTLISLTRLLSATVLNATNILGSLGQPSSLVYLTSFDVVQSNYGSTKAYLCCDVPGEHLGGLR